ncbi:MAG: hypothetical protein JO265_00970 [Acidimicrobiia bacterium]|nr:hypothetical protein [Acidimicrobiia bacterium]
METAEISRPAERASFDPTGAGVGVWVVTGFVALLALCVSIVALVVAVSHETKPTATVAAPPPTTPPPTTPAGTDTVTLREYNVNVVPTTLTPGTHAFTIANDGRTEHELLVFHTDLDPAAFPLGQDGDINEEAPGMNKISDGDNIAPGGTQQRTVDLSRPGTYVFVCNLPGHFKAGMYQVVTVK